ncbi:hypothetical protein ACWD4G_33335 [Streptomyces sp. NPDC002643]
MATTPDTANSPHLVDTPQSSPSNHDRTINLWSGLGLILLLPMSLGSWLLRLSTAGGSRCLTYGEGCSTIPGGLPNGFFWASIASGLLVAAWPRTRWTSGRYWAVAVQWAAQIVLCGLIAGGA